MHFQILQNYMSSDEAYGRDSGVFGYQVTTTYSSQSRTLSSTFIVTNYDLGDKTAKVCIDRPNVNFDGACAEITIDQIS